VGTLLLIAVTRVRTLPRIILCLTIRCGRELSLRALATMNGVGDFISSFAVGILWSAIGFSACFTFAAVVGAARRIALLLTNHHEAKAKIIG
jgi:hypothetical protein